MRGNDRSRMVYLIRHKRWWNRDLQSNTNDQWDTQAINIVVVLENRTVGFNESYVSQSGTAVQTTYSWISVSEKKRRCKRRRSGGERKFLERQRLGSGRIWVIQYKNKSMIFGPSMRANQEPQSRRPQQQSQPSWELGPADTEQRSTTHPSIWPNHTTSFGLDPHTRGNNSKSTPRPDSWPVHASSSHSDTCLPWRRRLLPLNRLGSAPPLKTWPSGSI